MPFRTNAGQRALLLSQLGALNAREVREFAVQHDLPRAGKKKDELLETIAAALHDRGGPSWKELVLYLDQVEPYGRQHVYAYKPDGAFQDWGDRQFLEDKLQAAGQIALLDTPTALAAPAAVTLGSITLDEDGVLGIQAISKRTYLRRRAELDEEVDGDALPGQNTVARVYEEVSARSWVRLRCETESGACSVHVAQLERKGDYEAVFEEFKDLIAGWFPVDLLQPIYLSRGIARLQEEYEADPDNAVVRVQASEYTSRGGRHGSISSARARQGVVGESAALNNAVTAMRESGPAATGNFYFRRQADHAQSPLGKDLHVTCVVKDNRINVRRPTEPAELSWVLGRIRHYSG